MKACILFLTLLLVIGSCSEDEQTFTSPVGKWKFAIKTTPITGSFEISDISDVLTINDAFGEFKMNGATYKVDTRQAISLGSTPGTFLRFWLVNTAQDREVAFDDVECSADFKTITAKNFYYREGNTTSALQEETIVMTRY